MKVKSMTLIPTLAGGGSRGDDIVVVLCHRTMIFTMEGVTMWVIGEKCEIKVSAPDNNRLRRESFRQKNITTKGGGKVYRLTAIAHPIVAW
jgi:hypothetical protein